MLFCPVCANMILVDNSVKGFRFFCATCNFYYPVLNKIKNSIMLKTKQVDDILGGKEAWENVDQTTENCPKCAHQRAYYKQIQIRSADEPMTIFYKCANMDCNYQWSQN